MSKSHVRIRIFPFTPVIINALGETKIGLTKRSDRDYHK